MCAIIGRVCELDVWFLCDVSVLARFMCAHYVYVCIIPCMHIPFLHEKGPMGSAP